MKRLNFVLRTLAFVVTLYGGSYVYGADATYQSPYTQTFISEVMVASGGSDLKDDGTKKLLQDAGYTPTSVDCNEDAGGKYVFIGYKTSTHPEDAITSFIIASGDYSKNPDTTVTVNGITYKRAYTLPNYGDGNLNEGAGGKKLYLFYSKDRNMEDGQTLVTEMETMAFGSAKKDSSYAKYLHSDGSVDDNADLNNGADGDYVYLSYKSNHTHAWENGFCTCGYQMPKQGNAGYEISNAGQLYWFMDLVNKEYGDVYANAVLTENIMVNENVLKDDGTLDEDQKNSFREWFPIGYYYEGKKSVSYYGTFDGQGHTINGLYFNNPEQYRVGLFGQTSYAEIKNVGVVNSYINGDKYVGGVCGYNYYGTITNSYNTGSVRGVEFIGGVCGDNYYGTTKNSYNTGRVSGTDYVGGVCGDNFYGTITNSYNSGSVSGTENVGGVCGFNYGATATITNCYNTGSVNGSGRVGGVCGCITNGTIVNCYNTGSVSGTDYVGGAFGYKDRGTITNCYYLSTLPSDANATPMTQDQFKYGIVAKALHKASDVWGQNVGVDPLPNFSGKVSNAWYDVKITAEGENGTIVQGVSGVYKPNSEIMITAEPNDGYHAKWNTGSSRNKQIFIVVSDTVITAAFEKHNYDNGFCTVCDHYQPAVETTDKYDMNGDGKNDKVYEISNAGQLYWFMEHVNQDGDNKYANAVLTKDIVVNEDVLKSDGTLNANQKDSYREWIPIGYYYVRINDGMKVQVPYRGAFDGQGHTISGLYFNDSEQENVGLIGLTEGSKIKNVGVVNSYFNGDDNVGGICGMNSYASTIVNCFNTGYVSGKSGVGGVCGVNNTSSTIENSYNTGSVNGEICVGGVCGDNYAPITNSYNTGSVSGTIQSVGGVCGYNGDTTANCYNTGSVRGVKLIGGVCGYNGEGTITNCYNIGSVGETNNYIGGVCGYNGEGTITNCYYLSTLSSDANATPMTQDQFRYGIVAIALHKASNVWGQNVKEDPLPNFSGKVLNMRFDVKILAEGENGTIVQGKSGYYEPNSEITIEAKPNTGYLVKWSNGSTENKQTITVVSDTVITASFILEDCKYNDNGFCTVCDHYQPAVETTDKYDLNGDGQNDKVYEIANAGQLYWFMEYVNKGGDNIKANAVLTKDIVLNEGVLKKDGTLNTNQEESFREWFPIGGKENVYYSGIFDGQGHTISGLYFNNPSQSCVGLFGTTVSSVIKNVGMIDSYVNGKSGVGGICGYYNGGTITNCYNTGSVNGSDVFVGGVCGGNEYGAITNCYNTGSVSGSDVYGGVGGVCGYNIGAITNCYNMGSVSGENRVGGVCGDNLAPITNCYYLNTLESDANATAMTEAQFANGEVAALLYKGENGQVWRQTLGVDPTPNFTGDPLVIATLYNGKKSTLCALKKNSYKFGGNCIAVVDDATEEDFTDSENLIWNNGSEYIAKSVRLVDSLPAYFPVDFTAEQISYTRTPSVYANKAQDATGWETLSLPFTTTAVTADDEPVAPFNYGGLEMTEQNLTQSGDFWAKQPVKAGDDTIYFAHIADNEFVAGIPYIIAFPGDGFDKYSLEDKNIVFSAENASVKATDDLDKTVEVEGYLVGGTTVGLSSEEAASFYNFIPADNAFKLNTDKDSIIPFRCYVQTTEQAGKSVLKSSRERFVFIGSYEDYMTQQDDITTILSDTDDDQIIIYTDGGNIYLRAGESGMATICNLHGQVMKSINYTEGLNNLGSFAQGVYLVNGVKVIVK